jgi:hypothetical protein
MTDKLPVWKGKLLHHSGRLILINTTLTVVPIHVAINTEHPP